MKYNNEEKKVVRLLIVEDDKLYRFALKELLERTELFKIVGEASDGKEAVEFARELKPDVILMGLGLPFLDGIEATKRIKQNYNNTKIIVLTSNSDKSEAIKSLEAGATAYVRKEINTDYLYMIIQTINKGAIWIDPLIGKEVLSGCIKYYEDKKTN